MLSMNLPRQSSCRTWIATFFLLALGTTGCSETGASRSESLDGGANVETAASDAPPIGTEGRATHEPALDIPKDNEDRRQWLRDRLKRQLGVQYDMPLPTASEEDLHQEEEASA